MSRSPEKLRAWATVNLSALERNLKAIRMALPSHLSYIAVVKANAYGHGLAPVVTRLMRSQADAFAVANLEEAARVGEIGKGWPVLLLSVLLPSEYEEAIQLGIEPVISSRDELEKLAGAAKKMGRKVKVHIKVDTGMGRLGVWHPNFSQLVDGIQGLNSSVDLAGVCTHFSSADTDPQFTSLQRQRFVECLKHLPDLSSRKILIHADNSAGIESFPKAGSFNAARIGLMQFGVRPRPGSLLQETLTEPVLSFHSRIGLIKDLPAGTPISYGQTHCLSRPSKVAVLTVGYADGLPTSLSNRGKVIIGDTLCPIIGRVTMDQTVVDLTDLDHRPETGDTATFIGKTASQSISASEFAGWAGRIEWEIFCSLSDRTQRIYHTDSAI